MAVKYLHLKQAIPSIALIFILTVVYWYNFQSSHTVEGLSCDLDNGQCTSVFDQKEVKVRVLDPLVIEEELNVQMEYPTTYKLTQAWIEGVNMFMGRSRLELLDPSTNAEKHNIKGIFFLGSCSEPKMQWKLVLEFTEEGGDEVHYREVRFSTFQGN